MYDSIFSFFTHFRVVATVARDRIIDTADTAVAQPPYV